MTPSPFCHHRAAIRSPAYLSINTNTHPMEQPVKDASFLKAATHHLN